MKSVGDYVIYRNEVCRIGSILEKFRNDRDYYELFYIHDEGLKSFIPVMGSDSYLRNLKTKDEINRILASAIDISVIDCTDNTLEQIYKKLLHEGGEENYIKIIKTTFVRNRDRKLAHKKVSDRDLHYFTLACKYFYDEVSVVLGCSFEEAQSYVEDYFKKEELK